jgi:enamine deaminase RidA (YjgF/YER057c/UK114 family)
MIEEKLAELGLTLPTASTPAASYVGFKIFGNMLIVSGQLPIKDGKPTLTGKLGDGVSVEEAYAAARQCALNILAQVKVALAGDWGRLVQGVRLGGFVACTPSFTEAPKIVNGASDLMVKVFGPAGMHARAAIGVASLPADVAVEVEAMFEIKP